MKNLQEKVEEIKNRVELEEKKLQSSMSKIKELNIIIDKLEKKKKTMKVHQKMKEFLTKGVKKDIEKQYRLREEINNISTAQLIKVEKAKRELYDHERRQIEDKMKKYSNNKEKPQNTHGGRGI